MAIGYYFIALLGICACITNAVAVETDQPKVTFGGFGSLGVSHSSMSMGDYTLDSTIPKGAGLSEDWSTTNDTRIAGHLAAKFTPKVSAVLQVVAEYNAENSYQPEIEWANVKYAFTPDSYIRVGRIALPTFLDSDNRDVGYTYVWIHPPIELYRQLAITHSDGVDAMYRVNIGEVGNTIKAIIYGENTIERSTSKSISKDMWGIFDTIEYGPTTTHIGYQERLSASQNIQTGVTGAWVRNSDLSVGVQYDPGNWFAMSEWIQRKSTTKISAMYVSAGYRVKKFTPYLTYSQNSPGSFLPGFPPPTSSSIRLANRSQSTVSLGVRWDFMKNTDLKLQYDQVKLSDNSNGFLANVPANVSLYGAKFHVISAVVDFIF
jgi:Gram-negative porin